MEPWGDDDADVDGDHFDDDGGGGGGGGCADRKTITSFKSLNPSIWAELAWKLMLSAFRRCGVLLCYDDRRRRSA